MARAVRYTSVDENFFNFLFTNTTSELLSSPNTPMIRVSTKLATLRAEYESASGTLQIQKVERYQQKIMKYCKIQQQNEIDIKIVQC